MPERVAGNGNDPQVEAERDETDVFARTIAYADVVNFFRKAFTIKHLCHLLVDSHEFWLTPWFSCGVKDDTNRSI
jgi:hypothetical protein